LRSTSGAGFHFEDLIAAWQLVKALSGEQTPGVGGIGTQLQAQVSALGWRIDDLLLVLAAEGLTLFRDPPPFQYVYYLPSGHYIQKTKELVNRYPPHSTDVRALLRNAVSAATISRKAFCAGIQEEVLAQQGPEAGLLRVLRQA
jgi:hypothetical protein